MATTTVLKSTPKFIIFTTLHYPWINLIHDDNFVYVQDYDDAFMMFDLGDVFKKHRKWVAALPRVTPFYGKL